MDMWDSETIDSTKNAITNKDGTFTGGTTSARTTNIELFKNMSLKHAH